MSKLIIASNRLPVKAVKQNQQLKFVSSAGGLAVAVNSIENGSKIWLGWPGKDTYNLDQKQKSKVKTHLKKFDCSPVYLSQRQINRYYYGFANKTIWPLFQYFPQYSEFKKSYWQGYQQVNQKFANKITSLAKPNDTIWIHDYQLMLVPQLIRQKLPEAKIGFFLHITFPTSELFRLLPWRQEILTGLLGADLIGFHTYDYTRHFLNSVNRILGYEYRLGEITTPERTVRAEAFPMGIDYQKYSQAYKNPKTQNSLKKLKKEAKGKKLILSVDRLDYTKGIKKRLEAFKLFLKKYPRFQQEVTLVLVAVPSRTKVDQYQELKKQIDEKISEINGQFGTIDWTPIRYLYQKLSFKELSAYYLASDVCLVTPLRDGMNLIAKEYVAAQNDQKGVLVLSELAGAAKELGETIQVNPFDSFSLAQAIKSALQMDQKTQKEINQSMQLRLRRYSVQRWAKNFLTTLSKVKKIQGEQAANFISQKENQNLKKAYQSAQKRLILLDYDGTLVPFNKSPSKSKPSPSLKKTLESLTKDQKNQVVVVSGRSKNILGRWLGKFKLGLVAEHGIWIRQETGRWEMIEELKKSWKDEIRPQLRFYVDQTPGSFIEEKDFSLAWHYRQADPKLAPIRVKQLKQELRHRIANLDLAFLEGHKVLEIKRADINKGRAVSQWLARGGWDFILAIGDDATDEDIFDACPDDAFTIRVGSQPSQAKMRLRSYRQVLDLLENLSD